MSDARRTSTRDDIVQVARRLFYVKGFENTSLGDLAAELNVPKGNLYYHFRSKDDVLRAVIEARRVHVETALAAWAAQFPSPGARLRRMVDMLSREADDLTQYGCPTGSLLTELGKARPELASEVRVMMDLYVQFAFDQFVELGLSKKNARTSAERLLSRLQGAVLLSQAYRDAKLLRREVLDIRRWIAEVSSAG